MVDTQFGRPKTAEFLSQLIESNNLTPVSLSKILHVKTDKVFSWLEGMSVPKGKQLTQLSKLFNVSIDEILLGQFINDNPYAPRSFAVNQSAFYSNADEIKRKNSISKFLKISAVAGGSVFVIFVVIICVALQQTMFKNIKVVPNETSYIIYSDHKYVPLTNGFNPEMGNYPYDVDANLNTNGLEKEVNIQVYNLQPFVISMNYGLSNVQYFVREDVDLSKLEFTSDNIKYIILEDDNEITAEHYQEIITDKQEIKKFIDMFSNAKKVDSEIYFNSKEVKYYVNFVYEDYNIDYLAGEVFEDMGQDYLYIYDSDFACKYEYE